MIWGVSFALHEKAVVDHRSGRTLNANLGEYHIPVNADVPSLEAILVEERDEHVNALGIKGVGEIGVTGTAGAIANAVWHATGRRIRSFPITLDRLIGLSGETGGPAISIRPAWKFWVEFAGMSADSVPGLAMLSSMVNQFAVGDVHGGLADGEPLAPGVDAPRAIRPGVA